MINNRKTIKCDKCGKDGHLTVVADGLDNAPASLRRNARGPCGPDYYPISAQEMHKLTGLPLSGWSETKY